MNKSPSESMSFITEVICTFIFTDVHMRNNYRLNRALATTVYTHEFPFVSLGNSLSFHDGQKFTTLDKDQDVHKDNCAKIRLGAFWYKDCVLANPNGMYIWGEDPTHLAIGDIWHSWKGYYVGMKSISMKIKRVS